AAVMLRRGLRTRRTEDAETAALGTAPRTDADAAVTSHDDPVLDQPGPDTVETADGIHHHHGEPELPLTPARPPSPRRGVVIALGLAMRRASGTSLLVMVIATASSLLARVGTDVDIDWVTTLVFAGGSAVGGMLGGPLSAKARPSTLTLLFAALLAGVAVVTLVETLLLLAGPGPEPLRPPRRRPGAPRRR